MINPFRVVHWLIRKKKKKKTFGIHNLHIRIYIHVGYFETLVITMAKQLRRVVAGPAGRPIHTSTDFVNSGTT